MAGLQQYLGIAPKVPGTIDRKRQNRPHFENSRGGAIQMIGPRQILLGGVAFFALSGAAVAADMPIRAPQQVYTKAASVWSWEGQYIGVHGGYFDGTNEVGPGVEIGPRGGYGGLQFGYLHHLSRNWLIGYEVDVSFGDVDGSIAAGTNTINFFGTARTRLGYAQGPWLYYATAGLAWAQTELVSAGSGDRAQIGYAVGAGVEYALSRNWSAKFEYLYMDLGDTVSTGAALTTDLTAHTVRLGLNYRFANWNPAAPASAFPVKAPVYRAGWTGPYIGIHGGYGFGDYDQTGIAVASLEPSGGVFGIQSGYNWQISPNFVFGVEGDSSWGSLKDAVAGSNVDIDAMGTVRARFGYAAGNTLFYATGGLAWIHADSVSPASVRDNFYLGWTVGAGVEYALSQKWSAKAEYLYSNFGSTDIGAGFIREDFDLHTLKVGINYRAGVLDLLGMRW